MPFPSDEKIMETSRALVAQFHAMFGPHPGYRPAHAKGVLVDGVFTPSAEAAKLSTAPQFNNPSTPITVRFSNSTGLPDFHDGEARANPRGVAIRFNLGLDADGRRVHTDLVGHSVPFFPVRTGELFLEFLKAAYSSPPGTPSPAPIEVFLASHPSAMTFAQYPKPTPSSYARQAYFGVHAFKLIDAAGKSTSFRWRIVPELGVETLDDAESKVKDFLQHELASRLKEGPVEFKLIAQIAEDGDEVDDSTVRWPETRPLVELGTLKLTSYVYDSAQKVKYMIFDPVPRVQGVEPSADPLIEMRAAVYLISGKERRAAPDA